MRRPAIRTQLTKRRTMRAIMRCIMLGVNWEVVLVFEPLLLPSVGLSCRARMCGAMVRCEEREVARCMEFEEALKVFVRPQVGLCVKLRL